MRRALLLCLASCSTLVRSPHEVRVHADPTASCTDGYLLPSLDVALTAAVAGGTVYAGTHGGFDDCEALGCTIMPLGILAMIAMPLITLDGFYKVHDCRVTKAELAVAIATEHAREQRAAARDEAWQRTKQAALAARAGDCAAVREASTAVQRLDADFHAVVFARDRAIATCLAK